MDEQIKELVISVSRLIKHFSDGAISPDIAREEYLALLRRFEDLRNTRRSGDETGIIKNLCYRHNGENFSLFSGIFRLTRDNCEPVGAVGDERLHGKIIQASRHIRAALQEGEYACIRAGDVPVLSHHLHLLRVYADESFSLIFAALSSSEFFSIEKFKAAGAFFAQLLQPFTLKKSPLMFLQFDHGIGAIRAHLEKTVDEKTFARVHVIFLRSVESIFSHMGMASLIELPDTIRGILRESAPENSTVFMLSINEYLIITSIRRSADVIPRIKPVELRYRGTIIPHNSVQLRFDTGDSIYKLFDDIFNFESYILKGDTTA